MVSVGNLIKALWWLSSVIKPERETPVSRENENKGTTLGHNYTMYMLVPISAIYSSFLLALLSPLSSILSTFTHTTTLDYD